MVSYMKKQDADEQKVEGSEEAGTESEEPKKDGVEVSEQSVSSDSGDAPDAGEQSTAVETEEEQVAAKDAEQDKPKKVQAKSKARPSSKEKEEDDEEEEEEDVPSEQSPPEFENDDPLAPAYDLERGTLLDKQHDHSANKLPWRSGVESPKEFFSAEVLYRYDVLEPEDQKKLAGKYRMELKGFQGGVWTINIAEDLEIVNRKEDADLVLSMQPKDFLQLVNGTLNPQLAILSQKMKVTGDVKKAIQFQQLLAPTPE